MQGTVIFFKRPGGWGFISANDDDYFVHHSELVGRNSLREGQQVEFDIGQRNGKPLAVNVKVIAEAPAAPKSEGGGQ